MTGPLYLHPLRRNARALSADDCLERIRHAEWGTLSLCDPDGRAYGAPLHHALREPEGGGPFASGRFSLVFHCAGEGLKLDLLDSTAEACFTIVPLAEAVPARLSTRFECVMAFGPVRRVDPGSQRHDDLLRFLGLRFSAAHPDALAATLEKSGPRATVLELDIRGLTGKFNPCR